MTNIEKLNAEIAGHTEEIAGHTEEIARLTAERDALEKPVSDAERWAREYQSALRKASDYWAEFDTFSEYRQSQFLAAMQPVIDGIRAEWAQERDDLIIRERHSNDVIDQYIEELWSTRKELTTMAAERNKYRNTNQNHIETLRSIAKMEVSQGDCMVQHARDALSGYIEPAETTMFQLQTKCIALEAERDALAARVQKVGVGFDVTPDEFRRALRADSSGDDFVKFAIRYLAEHATAVQTKQTDPANYLNIWEREVVLKFRQDKQGSSESPYLPENAEHATVVRDVFATVGITVEGAP